MFPVSRPCAPATGDGPVRRAQLDARSGVGAAAAAGGSSAARGAGRGGSAGGGSAEAWR